MCLYTFKLAYILGLLVLCIPENKYFIIGWVSLRACTVFGKRNMLDLFWVFLHSMIFKSLNGSATTNMLRP